MRKLSFSANSKGDRVAFIDGVRTPFVQQLSLYKELPAVQLGQIVVNELLNRTQISPKLIDRLIFGQVIQMPKAPNIAREIVLGIESGINIDAHSITKACITSLQAVASLAEGILAGSVEVGIAGGADSSSILPIELSPRFAQTLLQINKAKNARDFIRAIEPMHPKDLLPVYPSIAEYSTGLRMGDTAEQMAKSYQISRKEQDYYAYQSHQKALAAWRKGKLTDGVMTVYVPPFEQFIEQDNTLRDSNLTQYGQLKPVFDIKYGTVTAGNSSPLTDGAAAVLMMNESTAKKLGLIPLGFLRSFAFTAIDVWHDMLLGPVYATPLALDKAGIAFDDISLIDMHEAFAAQVLTNMKLFDSKVFAQERLQRNKAIGKIAEEKFNVLGGSLAYGHPFAATGIRLIMQNLHELKQQGGGLGLITSCAAGGLGSAMVLEVE